MDRLILCRAVLSALALLAAPTSHGQELPPEIQIDRLLVQAERETASGEHWSAAITLERILEIHEEHGLEIPAAFWFRRAGVLQAAGFHEQAIESSTRYLQEAGREGEHYQAALVILDAAEVDLAEARRAEARARAAVEQAEREAAARAAAIAGSVPEMVVIPAGTFRMGCVTRGNCDGDERPVHEVRVASLELSKHEVTFAQWDVCVEYGGCRRVNDEGRGRANCDGCGSQWDNEQTAPVGSFPPNGFGLFDMHGNVSEWVQDCWNDSYRGAPSDGDAWTRGDCSRRVTRGGSWAWSARYVRVSYRGVFYAYRAYNSNGFRIARSLTQ